MIKFHRQRYGRFLLINTDWLVIDPAGGKDIPFSRIDDRRQYTYFVPCFYYGSLPHPEEV